MGVVPIEKMRNKAICFKINFLQPATNEIHMVYAIGLWFQTRIRFSRGINPVGMSTHPFDCARLFTQVVHTCVTSPFHHPYKYSLCCSSIRWHAGSGYVHILSHNTMQYRMTCNGRLKHKNNSELLSRNQLVSNRSTAHWAKRSSTFIMWRPN